MRGTRIGHFRSGLDSFLTDRRQTEGVESTLFWISPERVRGSQTFRTCSSCGKSLFRLHGDRLEFHGTHPRQVLCMPCRDAQIRMSRESSWPNLSSKTLSTVFRGQDRVRPTSIAVFLTASVVVSLVLTVAIALRPVDRSAPMRPFEEISDLALVYVPNNQGFISDSYLSPYVSILDEEGNSREWLFDTFLFIALQADTNSFWDETQMVDWKWWINRIFTDGQQIDALNDEVDRVKESIGGTKKRGVIISVPYPSPSTDNFGIIPGTGALNFRIEGREEEAADHRLEACKWFMDEIIREWHLGGYHNLEFLGFYWLQEELYEGDTALVNGISDYAHELGYSTYWIPYNSEANMEALQTFQNGGLQFDYVWIQPNYAFRDRPSERWRELWDLDIAAQAARRYNVSIEIEVDKSEFLSGDIAALNSFYHYLDGGLTHLYIDKPLAYYVFPADMYWSRNSLVRQSYDALCEFVKGRHEPINYVLHCNLSEVDFRSRTNHIRLGPGTEWGRVENVYGTPARLATPDASFTVEDLDPTKDLVLSINYLTLHEGAIEATLGRDKITLGNIIADGKWHTGQWNIELSRWGRKNFEVKISNLTWISDVWVYPDETIFRLKSSALEGPGLYTDESMKEGTWRLSGLSVVRLEKVDPQKKWLVGITYRADRAVGIDLSNELTFQSTELQPAQDWETVVFTINPHGGSSNVLLTFEGNLEIGEMWASPSILHTNVGTDWDTNPHRHSPGISIGEGWSAPRNTRQPEKTYRSGSGGSTMFISPIAGDDDNLVTIQYRSDVEISLYLQLDNDARELAVLPPNSAWGIHTFAIPPEADDLLLTVSGNIDVSHLWITA